MELADGKEYYAGLYMVHDSTSRKLGAIIPKGSVMYQEGTKGKTTGNHIHLEVFRYNPTRPILPKRVADKGNRYGSYMFQDYMQTIMENSLRESQEEYCSRLRELQMEHSEITKKSAKGFQ